MKAILFDMDGVLVDVSNSYLEAIVQSANSLALPTRVTRADVAIVKSIAGFNNDWDASYALAMQSIRGRPLRPLSGKDRRSYEYSKIKDAFQRAYLGESWDGLIARETPMVEAKLLALAAKHAKLGIVTGRPRAEALHVINRFGWQEFFPQKSLVALEDCVFEKPRPEPILAGLMRIGVPTGYYLGDSPSDKLAAQAANCQFIEIHDDTPAQLAKLLPATLK